MDALCLNVDRHTQNYGVLRNRSDGTIVGMTLNFDNNIALISRGYGPDVRQTNEFLLNLFEEFLQERSLRIPRPSWMRNPSGKSRVGLFLTRILTEAMWQRWYAASGWAQTGTPSAAGQSNFVLLMASIKFCKIESSPVFRIFYRKARLFICPICY